MPEQAASTLNTLRRIILTWLVRRDYTQHEITQKCLSKGYSPTDVANVVSAMTEENLINEDRFTESYLHFRRGKGFGPLRITADLKARGISPEMIAKHLEIADNTWLTVAQAIWRKHFKSKPPEDAYSRAKQQRFLQQRGFTWEQIQKVLGGCD